MATFARRLPVRERLVTRVCSCGREHRVLICERGSTYADERRKAREGSVHRVAFDCPVIPGASFAFALREDPGWVALEAQVQNSTDGAR